MTAHARNRNGYTLLRPTGVLDGRTEESKRFEALIDQACDQPHDHCIIDLSQVEYINSGMLGLMVRLLYSLQGAEKRLVLLAPPKSVESVLTMTGLAELMPLAADEGAACAALGVAAPAPRTAEEQIDYEQLTAELERIIAEGDSGRAAERRRSGELRKLLGE